MKMKKEIKNVAKKKLLSRKCAGNRAKGMERWGVVLVSSPSMEMSEDLPSDLGVLGPGVVSPNFPKWLADTVWNAADTGSSSSLLLFMLVCCEAEAAVGITR